MTLSISTISEIWSFFNIFISICDIDTVFIQNDPPSLLDRVILRHKGQSRQSLVSYRIYYVLIIQWHAEHRIRRKLNLYLPWLVIDVVWWSNFGVCIPWNTAFVVRMDAGSSRFYRRKFVVPTLFMNRGCCWAFEKISKKEDNIFSRVCLPRRGRGGSSWPTINWNS